MRRIVASALLVSACGGGTSTPPDGASPIDAPVAAGDASPAPDAVLPLSWVDFTVSGCATFDPAGPTCFGDAPLVLRFSAVSPAPIDTWLWDFGDGTTASTSTPEHTFVTPGASHSIELRAGGPGGTALARKEMFVQVLAAPLGARCAEDAHCASGRCACPAGDPAGCPPSLRAGLCTDACSSHDDCGAGVCVDLGPAGPPWWWDAACLAPCVGDADCAPGLVCRELLAEDAWVRGCFAPSFEAVSDDGASCLDAAGLPDDGRCASGSCVSLGARGLCAAPCQGGQACPSYAACATIPGAGAICLARCSAWACSGDPWLACEAPGPGDLGFTVEEPADPAGYCAPRRCEGDDDCGPDGACQDHGGALFCGPG